MAKFKVGDRVVGNAKADGRYMVTKKGWTGYVVEVTGSAHITVNEDKNANYGYPVCPDYFDLVKEVKADFPKVVITTDGKTTLARYYEGGKVAKRAEAKCHPKDEFDFAIGAKLACERLMDTKPEGKIKVDGRTLTSKDIKWRVVNKAPRVGGYVRLKDCKGLFCFDRPGDICRVTELLVEKAIKVSAEDHIGAHEDKERKLYGIASAGGWTYLACEYEVVEPVGWLECVEEKPKYYSGKVVCTDSDTPDFTMGKVYEVVNGKLIDNKGEERPGGTRATSVDALNKAYYCNGNADAHVHFVPFMEAEYLERYL